MLNNDSYFDLHLKLKISFNTRNIFWVFSGLVSRNKLKQKNVARHRHTYQSIY